MRLNATSILAAFTLLFAASNADAYRTDLSAFVGGNPYGGEALQVGDLIEIQVDLDTEGGNDMLLVGLGVLFDEGSFTYRQDLSSLPSTYLFYVSAKLPWLIPASTCVPVCKINGIISNQVQLDWISTALTTPAGAAGSGVGTLSLLVFEVVDTTAGSADFSFQVIDGQLSTVFQLGDLSFPPLTLGPDIPVTLPEPTIGLLSLTAIGTIAMLRRRRRA